MSKWGQVLIDKYTKQTCGCAIYTDYFFYWLKAKWLIVKHMTWMMNTCNVYLQFTDSMVERAETTRKAMEKRSLLDSKLKQKERIDVSNGMARFD